MAGRRRQGTRSELTTVLRKRRWSASEPQMVLEAQRRSGMSLATYARRHGVTRSRLDACRRRLEQTATRPTPQLIPIHLVDRSTGSTDAIEILIGGGRRLRVLPGFDATLLARVIEVLESVAC